MRSLAILLSAIALAALSACTSSSTELDTLHDGIAADFETVTQLSPEAFQAMDPKNTLVLDLRAPAEYAVSRIPGAIWVSPDADAQSALIQIGDVKDKDIIVYCSVGVRSSIFAQRAQEDLLKMGAVSVANLEHGIFGWHNDQRALVDANGTTDVVHPYDAKWGRYVKRSEKTQYTPVPKN